jgi:hypothetical protein
MKVEVSLIKSDVYLCLYHIHPIGEFLKIKDCKIIWDSVSAAEIVYGRFF